MHRAGPLAAVLLAVAGMIGMIPPSAAQDKPSLLEFKASASDPELELQSWSADTEPCAAGWDDYAAGWEGVLCDAPSGRVVWLYKYGFLGEGIQLGGRVERLAGLTALRSLNLADTLIQGSIEPLAALTSLEWLALSFTAVSGSVEPLAALTQLSWLDLSSSDVGGSLQPLAALTSLGGCASCPARRTGANGLDLRNTRVVGDARPLRAIPALGSGW